MSLRRHQLSPPKGLLHSFRSAFEQHRHEHRFEQITIAEIEQVVNAMAAVPYSRAEITLLLENDHYQHLNAPDGSWPLMIFSDGLFCDLFLTKISFWSYKVLKHLCQCQYHPDRFYYSYPTFQCLPCVSYAYA